ncbi:MAG: tetratricopeptide repeat protein [Algoriphagus sp.]|nr:tetratricopeptide repeat protein [Algoriphagus sp.]
MQGHFEYPVSKRCFVPVFILLLTLITILEGQAQTIENLKADLEKLGGKPGFEKDTAYLNKANELGFMLAESNPDSAFIFLDKQLEFCRNAKYKRGEADALKIYGNALQNKGEFKSSIGYYNDALVIAKSLPDEKLVPGILNNIGLVYYNLGDYAEALNNFYEAIKGAEKVNNLNVKAAALNNVALIYFEQEKLEEAKAKYREMLAIYSDLGNQGRMILAYNNIGDVELKQNRPLEALKTLKKGHESALALESPEFIEMTSRTLADIFSALDSIDKAEALYRQSIAMSKENGYGVPYSHSLIGLANLFYKKGDRAEALNYAKEGLKQAEAMEQTMQMRNANELLAKIYEEEGNYSDALSSFKLFKQYNDSINDSQSQRLAATLESEYEFSKKTLEYEKASLRQRWLIFSAFAGLLVFLVILFIVFRNRNQLNKAYHTLQEKTIEIGNKNVKLEKALEQLKATQLQLIQAEKMASLGELTAGIAHEIQNPLNFVNNFSEVSSELIDEIQAERAKKKESRAENQVEMEDEILADIKQNLSKITFHGRRADSIVKGMLEHSKKGSGQKELTNLNALADEFLRLTYQSLLAKDKDFHTVLKRNLDPDLPKVSVIPKDISKVLLNLYNNAFYACVIPHSSESGGTTKPTVTLTTSTFKPLQADRGVRISIKDNGPGIPEAIKDKIFQPFFTTKTTGEGTGLGLSLSYDIIKAHGGDLKVESKEGEGAEFIITLPIS